MAKELSRLEEYYLNLCKDRYDLSSKAVMMKKLSLRLETYKQTYEKLNKDENTMLSLQNDINTFGHNILLPYFKNSKQELYRFTTRLFATRTDKPIDNSFSLEVLKVREFLTKALKHRQLIFNL